MKIKQTHLPFWPKIRSDTIEAELLAEITKVAEYYGKHPEDFSASFELLPDPEGGHFLLSQVTYRHGKLLPLENK